MRRVQPPPPGLSSTRAKLDSFVALLSFQCCKRINFHYLGALEGKEGSHGVLPRRSSRSPRPWEKWKELPGASFEVASIDILGFRRLRIEAELRKQKSKTSTSTEHIYDIVEETTSSSDSSSETEKMAEERENMAAEQTIREHNAPPVDQEPLCIVAPTLIAPSS
ncbi:zinc finger BED domain-containing protein RICESLEEPER 2-like [Senna tora]|uniref:Zinc finger BED domain-containing protein RICESLEEPER 2-like n=1 Tax=Senna tora TaxID=362788 RepID=A0A834WG43_9FABA|nr:zinc finger BED domain-containing protein RICESLEEPER 2-like [Senna tora]